MDWESRIIILVFKYEPIGGELMQFTVFYATIEIRANDKEEPIPHIGVSTDDINFGKQEVNKIQKANGKLSCFLWNNHEGKICYS